MGRCSVISGEWDQATSFGTILSHFFWKSRLCKAWSSFLNCTGPAHMPWKWERVCAAATSSDSADFCKLLQALGAAQRLTREPSMQGAQEVAGAMDAPLGLIGPMEFCYSKANLRHSLLEQPLV